MIDHMNEPKDADLFQLALDGDFAARDLLVVRHQYLIRHFLSGRRYRNLTPTEREDLAQEANLGLIRAVDDYRQGRGSFKSLALSWIRHSVDRAMPTTVGPVKIPKTERQLLAKVRAARAALAAYDQDDSIEATCHFLGLDDGVATKIERLMRSEVGQPLDTPDEDGTSIQVACDCDVVTDVVEGEFQERVQRIIDRLRPEQQDVVRHVHGIHRTPVSLRAYASQRRKCLDQVAIDYTVGMFYLEAAIGQEMPDEL